MNVALVYDRVNKYGGAERVLEALHKLWPDAPLYTAVYDKESAPWASSFDVRPSFLQAIPFAKSHHEPLAPLAPLAFEQFNFDAYDVVISVTSAEAKGILTKPKTLHICYCLTPTRYLWSGFATYEKLPGLGALSQISAFGLRLLAPTLRRWDKIAASRPDHYIAISNRVARRIKKYYGKSSTVIYPPVSVQKFRLAKDAQNKSEYYLVVSRLVGYKRLDIIVQAFRELRLPLVIIGDGKQKAELQNNAAPTTRFVDRHLTDSELANYYQNCRAFIHTADEDFGISMVEAQACGKPVIAYRASAASEIVVPGKTGILFERQSVASLKAAVTASRRRRFDPAACRTNALRFSSQAFKQAMMKSIEDLYEQHIKTL
jgi:glycosyltransferase involved in cell wall biosynthesis